MSNPSAVAVAAIFETPGTASVAEWITTISVFVTAITAIMGLVAMRRMRKQAIEHHKEVRQETKDQFRAVCIVAVARSPLPDGAAPLPAHASELESLHQKWRTMLQPRYEDALKQKRHFYLTLFNDGKSRITMWRVTGTVSIDPGSLAKDLPVEERAAEWSVERSASEYHIAPGGSITIELCGVEAFPRVEFSWTVVYYDSRGRKAQADQDPQTFATDNVFFELPATPNG